MLCAVVAREGFGDIAVQFGFGLSAVTSLRMLAQRPLLNPVQSFVLIVYVWFGFGPCTMYLWSTCVSPSRQPMANELAASSPAAALAALGLPLYAVCANLVMSWLDASRTLQTGYSLGNRREQPKVLFIAAAVWFAAELAQMLLVARGDTSGTFESVGMLGGLRVQSWWLGIVLACQAIGPWLLSALIWFIVQPRSRRPEGTELIALPVVIFIVIAAVIGGWKSPLAKLVAVYSIAWTCRRQRPPWLLAAVFIVIFILLIIPFVRVGRLEAESMGADSGMRQSIFLDLAQRPAEWVGRLDVVDISELFRGISWVGSEAIRRSDLLEGPWGAQTFLWAMEVVVPRPLLPEKRDMNIGNFVAQEIGVDLGLSTYADKTNSIAVFIPCEICASFGWFAGWLSFGLIGAAWAYVSCAVLGSRSLANHPFCPMLVMLPLAMEGNIGHFLPLIRNLIFGLVVLMAIKTLVRRTVS